MARTRQQEEQELEPDQTLNNEAEEIAGDVLERDALTVQEEEFVHEAEEEEQEGAREEGSALEPVHWYYLTVQEREERRERVRVWLEQSQRENARQVFDDVLDLTVDKLVGYTFEGFYQRCLEVGKPQERNGEGWQKHLKAVEEEAASRTNACKDDLVDSVRQDKDATRVALIGTMDWWRKERQTGKPGHLDGLLERCADQVAAVLVFKNLPNLRLLETLRVKLWWDPLLDRVARAVIIYQQRELAKQEGRRSMQTFVSEDQLHRCIESMIKHADPKKFSFETVGQAMRFFATGLDFDEKQDRRRTRSPQPEHEQPLPESKPTRDKEGRGDTERRFMHTPFELTADITGKKILEHDDQEGERQPDQDERESERQRQRQQQWESLVGALGREEAVKLRILEQLLGRNEPGWEEKLGWEEIAVLVSRPQCGILDNEDLPPGVTWDEVERAFQEMAQSARTNPGVLTADALRKFYSRTREKLEERQRLRKQPHTGSPL